MIQPDPNHSPLPSQPAFGLTGLEAYSVAEVYGEGRHVSDVAFCLDRNPTVIYKAIDRAKKKLKRLGLPEPVRRPEYVCVAPQPRGWRAKLRFATECICGN